jgi:hypothetical protein
MAWLLCFIPCLGPFWSLYNFWVWLNEIKAYLEDDEVNPIMELVLCLIPFYSFYLIVKMGGWIQKAQIKAGHSDAQDQGIMLLVFCLICGFGLYKIQDELNKAWA